MFYIYILHSNQADKFYVGHSQDPFQRVIQHERNSGHKYTGSYSDWILVGVFEAGVSRGEAVLIEKFIKKQKSKKFIQRILDPQFTGTGILSRLVRVPHVRD